MKGKKNGTREARLSGKGCFGGSMPGKKKQLMTRRRTNLAPPAYKTVTATTMFNGTTGSKMVNKWLKRKLS